jgi:hypothetical protein
VLFFPELSRVIHHHPRTAEALRSARAEMPAWGRLSFRRRTHKGQEFGKLIVTLAFICALKTSDITPPGAAHKVSDPMRTLDHAVTLIGEMCDFSFKDGCVPFHQQTPLALENGWL